MNDVISLDVVKSVSQLHQWSKYKRDSSWRCAQYENILIKKNVVVKIFATGLEDPISILLVTDTVVYNVELWWCTIFSFHFIILVLTLLLQAHSNGDSENILCNRRVHNILFYWWLSAPNQSNARWCKYEQKHLLIKCAQSLNMMHFL